VVDSSSISEARAPRVVRVAARGRGARPGRADARRASRGRGGSAPARRVRTR
jgi:hypothetical protein